MCLLRGPTKVVSHSGEEKKQHCFGSEKLRYQNEANGVVGGNICANNKTFDSEDKKGKTTLRKERKG